MGSPADKAPRPSRDLGGIQRDTTYPGRAEGDNLPALWISLDSKNPESEAVPEVQTIPGSGIYKKAEKNLTFLFLVPQCVEHRGYFDCDLVPHDLADEFF